MRASARFKAGHSVDGFGELHAEAPTPLPARSARHF